MAGRGVLYALNDDETATILEAEGEEDVCAAVAAIEEGADRAWLCEVDKAWDGIHRCLTDGNLEWRNGEYPVNHAILGGRRLCDNDAYIIVYVTPAQVADVARALPEVTYEQMRGMHALIDPEDYEFAGFDDDFEYLSGWFHRLVPFYAKAASDERPVIFTVRW